MKKRCVRLFSVVLMFVLVISLFPVIVIAADVSDFENEKFEEGVGTTPESAFYFIDRFFDRFMDELEVKKESGRERRVTGNVIFTFFQSLINAFKGPQMTITGYAIDEGGTGLDQELDSESEQEELGGK